MPPPPEDGSPLGRGARPRQSVPTRLPCTTCSAPPRVMPQRRFPESVRQQAPVPPVLDDEVVFTHTFRISGVKPDALGAVAGDGVPSAGLRASDRVGAARHINAILAVRRRGVTRAFVADEVALNH